MGRMASFCSVHLYQPCISDSACSASSSDRPMRVKLLETRPDYIVKEKETIWLGDKPAAAALLAERLAEDYERIAIIGGAEVFRLVEASI